MSENPPEWRHGNDGGGSTWPAGSQVDPAPWTDQTGPVPPPRAPEPATGPVQLPQDSGYPGQPHPAQPQWGQQHPGQPYPAQPQWGQQPPPQQWPAQPQWGQQQWSPQQQPPPPPSHPHWAPKGPVPPGQRPPAPPKKGSNQGLVIGIVVGLVVLLAGGGVGLYLWQRSGSSNSSGTAAATSSAAASSRGTRVGVPSGETPTVLPPPAAPTTVSPEQLQAQAAAQLEAMRQASLARLPLDSRWVAQVASKSVGISDPLQTAQNGTHVFQATDILAESQAALTKVGGDASKVYLVQGTDFGKRSQAPNGLPYWITLVDAGFASKDNVTQWCHTAFAALTPQQLADTCAPRQLTPPHA